MSPDDRVHLGLPPDDDLAAVASIAVRAAGRQAALSEDAIDLLRRAVEKAFHERVRDGGRDDVEVTLLAERGHLVVTVDSVAVVAG